MGWQIARVCYGFLVVWFVAVLVHGLWRQASWHPPALAEPPAPGHH